MIDSWEDIGISEAIVMLDGREFPIIQIREKILNQFVRNISDFDFALYLFQFIQLIKYEEFDDSELIRFILIRILGNPQTIGFYAFWQLLSELNQLYAQFSFHFHRAPYPNKPGLNQSLDGQHTLKNNKNKTISVEGFLYYRRMRMILETYLLLCGDQLFEFSNQYEFINELLKISRKIKEDNGTNAATTPSEKLQFELQNSLFLNRKLPSFRYFSYPFSSMTFTNILPVKSKVLDSNAAPFWISTYNLPDQPEMFVLYYYFYYYYCDTNLI